MRELADTIYTFCSDPGHGWLEVPRIDIARVGLSATDLSTYSYYNDEYFYCEGDMDYAIFCNAFKRTVGRAPNVRYIPATKSNHRIRRMPRNTIGCTDFAKLTALMG